MMQKCVWGARCVRACVKDKELRFDQEAKYM